SNCRTPHWAGCACGCAFLIARLKHGLRKRLHHRAMTQPLMAKEPTMHTRKFSASHLVVALVAAGVFGAAGAGALTRIADGQADPATLTTPSSSAPVGAATLPDFSQITQSYGPAVVNISVTGARKVADD